MSTLTRAGILDAAIAIGDARGLAAVTVRGVAQRLEVTPMALYRHVGGKVGLLDELADELYARLEREQPSGGWQMLRALARSARELLLAHPWALPLFARPLAGPHAQAAGETARRALRDAGFGGRDVDELHEQLTGMVFALVAAELQGRPNGAAFERGLELLRAGLEQRRRDAARSQLAALNEVARALDTADVPHWLFGGWAVDFHAGVVTRAHTDVDLAVPLADVPRIGVLLAAAGWRHTPDEDEDGGTGYERDGVRLELTFLVPAETGGWAVPLRRGPVPWSADALAGDVRELDGVGCRVVSLVSLRRSKARVRDDPEEAARDRADAAVLARLPGP